MPRHRHGLVVGKFAPLHRGHQVLIDAAVQATDELTIVIWSNPDFPDMPSEVRAGWLRTLYPNAFVIVGEDGPPNDAPDGVHRSYMGRILAQHGRRPDVVFTNEPYGPPLAAHLGIEHVAVGPPRRPEGVSGTLVRSNPHTHRGMLHPIVYTHFVEKVVFLGAESTGKSTLAAAAADAWRTVHVPEFGRSHYEHKGGNLDLNDYVHIARRQREVEDTAALHADRYLFVDTNAVTTMFFSHYYNRDSLPELRELADDSATRYHHVIVCHDDIEFEQDGWRDNAVWRGRMQGMVLHDLAVRRIGYSTVTGSVEQRLAQLRTVLDGGRVPSPAPSASLGPRPVETQ